MSGRTSAAAKRDSGPASLKLFSGEEALSPRRNVLMSYPPEKLAKMAMEGITLEIGTEGNQLTTWLAKN